jgi:hypothetical protein
MDETDNNVTGDEKRGRTEKQQIVVSFKFRESVLVQILLMKNKFRGLSPPANYNDRRLSANLRSTFADRGVSRSRRGGSPTAVISVS